MSILMFSSGNHTTSCIMLLLRTFAFPIYPFSLLNDIHKQLKKPLRLASFQANALSFAIETIPQQDLSFTKISALRQTLKTWLKEDWRITIVCSSLHQQSQLKMLLTADDLPIVVEQHDKKQSVKSVQICQGILSEGYIEKSSRTAFLSASELFTKQPTHRRKTLREKSRFGAN